jgi:GH35 family endo-1,4-beta-xylanase
MTNKTRLALLLTAVLAALAPSAGADSPAQLLASKGPEAFVPSVVEAMKSEATMEIVSVADAPGFDRAWRVQSGKYIANVEDVQLEGFSAIPVEVNGAALLHLWLRSPASQDESGKGHMFVHVRKNGVDFNSSLIATLEAGREWQEYYLPFRMIGTYPENGAVLRLRFGFPGQTVEVGGVEVLYYGPDTDTTTLPRTRFSYLGREDGAQWRIDALERIERIRKGNLHIRVVDAQGNPVEGATVRVRQTRSAFQFGSAVQLHRLCSDTAENDIYRAKILEYFNAAGSENDFKWPVWQGEWNSLAPYSHESAVKGLEWLRDNGIAARAHVLVWPGWKNLPVEVRQMCEGGRKDEVLPYIAAHIREMAEVTRGLVEEWDVLNEPYTNHDLMDIFGDQIMVEWFKLAREAMPGVTLAFNDFENHDQTINAAHVEHFEKTLGYLLDNGAPVDMLGLQVHISGQPNPPQYVLATLDRYEAASGGLPVRFTEFDIRTEDLTLQADYTRDFLILAYSHPTVVGMQLWGFWEPIHWIPVGAMLRGDWSEKPNAAVYRDLVLNQWRTNASLTTCACGETSIRAFQGDYEIVVEADGAITEAKATVAPGAEDTDIVIQL